LSSNLSRPEIEKVFFPLLFPFFLLSSSSPFSPSVSPYVSPVSPHTSYSCVVSQLMPPIAPYDDARLPLYPHFFPSLYFSTHLHIFTSPRLMHVWWHIPRKTLRPFSPLLPSGLEASVLANNCNIIDCRRSRGGEMTATDHLLVERLPDFFLVRTREIRLFTLVLIPATPTSLTSFSFI